MLTSNPARPDLLVLSHLRWDFVFQRPQHLMTRYAVSGNVFFVEEPIFENGIEARLDVTRRGERLHVVVPRLPAGCSEAEVTLHLKNLITDLVRTRLSRRYNAWYYTPMALKFTRHLRPEVIVYDCMDELSCFKSAPPDMAEMENDLFSIADVVFTGGTSLFEYKCEKHANMHPFPSSVDVAHFGKARAVQHEPEDQAAIAHPRIGYTGVVDERFDIELVRGVAAARPDWQIVIIGPVVKIDPATLPRAANIHYLGAKSYDELPRYLATWQVGLLPFARNDSTRFISPTKTPEYLAAGLKVVSTSIRDVVRVYGDCGLARIADEPEACVAAIQAALREKAEDPGWLTRVDAFLSRSSWDETFGAMSRLMAAAQTAAGKRALTALPRARTTAGRPAPGSEASHTAAQSG